MADNFEDKTLDKRTGTQSESPSDEILPTEEPHTINPNQETENMEVHHHPHVEKKNFKEYLLEGLMIFLAVTLGFIAENIREHFVHKEKERQYIHSFYTDLSGDEAQLPRVVAGIDAQQIQAADSLVSLLSKANTTDPANSIYYFIRRMIRQQGIKIFITDRTIEQAKNSGEFKLISNKQVADSLSEYYKLVDFVDYLQQVLIQYKNKLFDDFPPILKATDYYKTVDKENIIIIPGTLHLQSADPVAVNKILLSICEIKALSISIRSRVVGLNTKAGRIKKLLAEKYGLDE